MADIPPEIVADILSRVPAKSLLQLRCVSKSWRALIDSPEFIKLHLNRTMETNSDRKLIICCPRNLYSADFDEIGEGNEVKHVELNTPLKNRDSSFGIVGSCNGLVCLSNEDHDVVIWNPITRKHLKLPSSEFEFKGKLVGTRVYAVEYDKTEGKAWFGLAKRDFYFRFVIYGFGYDRVSDDYKVLRIVQSGSDIEVKVYSMKSNSWKRVNCFPYYPKNWTGQVALVAGSLHFVAERYPEPDSDSEMDPDSEMENLVVGFDLGTEEYRLVPLPEFSETNFDMRVDVLAGLLSVVCKVYDSEITYFDIWAMEEYGVKESWTKLFRIDNDRSEPFDFVDPIAYSENGRQVLVQWERPPLWYDPRNGRIRYLRFSPSIESFFMEYDMCFGSLVHVGERMEGVDKGNTKKSCSSKKGDDFLSKGFKLVL